MMMTRELMLQIYVIYLHYVLAYLSLIPSSSQTFHHLRINTVKIPLQFSQYNKSTLKTLGEFFQQIESSIQITEPTIFNDGLSMVKQL